MRLGVLDVGSSTVHLLVVDARPGGHPDPVRSHKTALHLAELPGVSAGRAAQLLAGAVVAHEAMPAFDLAEVQVRTWALREGVILRRLDELAGSAAPTSLGQR